MKTNVRVVVIGGGVVGASVLYHLTKLGWKDVQLLERAELTSGSTWHAAGGMHTVNGDPNVAKLQQYTIKLYNEIERISGQSCGMHVTGGRHAGRLARAHGLAEDDPGAGALPGHGARTAERPGDGEDLSADGPQAFSGRHPRSHRRTHRPFGRHAGVRKGGAIGRRRDRAPHPRHGHAPAHGRQLGCDHHPGHRARRAGRQCRWTVGSRSGPHGGPGAAGAGDGASVPDHRGPARICRAA